MGPCPSPPHPRQTSPILSRSLSRAQTHLRSFLKQHPLAPGMKPHYCGRLSGPLLGQPLPPSSSRWSRRSGNWEETARLQGCASQMQLTSSPGGRTCTHLAGLCLLKGHVGPAEKSDTRTFLTPPVAQAPVARPAVQGSRAVVYPSPRNLDRERSRSCVW